MAIIVLLFGHDPRALRTMYLICIPVTVPGLARHAVLLNPPKSSHSSQILSRQQSSPISPVAATLMDLLAGIANKRLTPWVNPLDATLTKNTGEC